MSSTFCPVGRERMPADAHFDAPPAPRTDRAPLRNATYGSRRRGRIHVGAPFACLVPLGGPTHDLSGRPRMAAHANFGTFLAFPVPT